MRTPVREKTGSVQFDVSQLSPYRVGMFNEGIEGLDHDFFAPFRGSDDREISVLLERIELWCSLMLLGSNRMEQDHYESFRTFLSVITLNGNVSLPHSNTVLGGIRRHVLDKLSIHPTYYSMVIREKSRGASAKRDGKTICLVSPMQYAFHYTLEYAWKYYSNWSADRSMLGNLPIIRGRRFFYSRDYVTLDEISVSEVTACIGEIGDIIRLRCSAQRNCPWGRLPGFAEKVDGRYHVTGEIRAIWMVNGGTMSPMFSRPWTNGKVLDDRYSSLSAFFRCEERHQSVHASSPDDEVLKNLGLRKQTAESPSALRMLSVELET